jgi:hypothetical protein
MVILGGNMRFKACKEAGLKEVPIIVADNLTEEQQREFLIKDNTSGGEWDFEMLANEWDVEQLDAWGLDIPNFEPDQVLEAEEDDFDGTPPEEPITVLGDLYEIGEHRLLCGDSTDSDTVAKLMNGEKADMVFTDPPYLGEMGSGGFSKDLKLQKSKDKKIDEIRSIYNFDPTDTFPIIELIKKEVTNIFLFCNKNLVPKYLNYAIDTNRLFDILTWHKTSFIPANNNTYYPDTEYLIKIKDKGAFFKTGLGNNVNYGKNNTTYGELQLCNDGIGKIIDTCLTENALKHFFIGKIIISYMRIQIRRFFFIFYLKIILNVLFILKID